jgi:hypothetical protein
MPWNGQYVSARSPKPEVLRLAAKELLQEARRDLEQAARSGAAIPAWLEEIITPAGREHYANVASEAGYLVDAAKHQREHSAVTKYRNHVTKIRCEIGAC